MAGFFRMGFRLTPKNRLLITIGISTAFFIVEIIGMPRSQLHRHIASVLTSACKYPS